MKQKIEIIKSIEIDDNTIVFIGKKIKTEPKKCINCNNMIFYDKVKRMGYCSKYGKIVSMEDACVEENI